MECRERGLQVVCVVRVVRGPLYSLERSVPAISLYGNVANQLLEDQINLPAKMHLDGKQGRFGRTTGSAGPTMPPLATVLLWYIAWWVLMSDGRCRGLVGRFGLSGGPFFVNETQVPIFCAFLVRSLVFCFVFNLWVPADHNSPKLVEPISKKPYK